jgi:hypothetical protein
MSAEKPMSPGDLGIPIERNQQESQVHKYKGFTAHTVREDGELTSKILIRDHSGEKVSEIEVPPTQTIGEAQKAVETEIDRLDNRSA